jgi:hypothetical protein
MNIQNQNSGPAAARSPEGQRSDDDKGSPPDRLGGEAAAQTQEGEPGLPVSDEKEWSPGSGQESVGSKAT